MPVSHRLSFRVAAFFFHFAWVASAPLTAQSLPLNDLGSSAYQGFQGGLYPGGSNVPPPTHVANAMAAAAEIAPLPNPANPSAPALIGVLSIGMSNTHQEWADFERRADATVQRNARVVVINGAVGGQSASMIDDPAAGYWQTVAQRLNALGVAPEQVQVVWLKEADQNPGPQFPLHASTLKTELRTIVQIIKDKYPNVRLCYLSSRIFGGYASGEPYAYHTGFSVKWLIEDQINADPALNFNPANGPVEAPVLLWGPYLWAEGLNPRSDGLTWTPADFEADFTHPSASGEQKVGSMLKGFFDTEPTAQAWWAQQPGWKLVSLPCSADATLSAGAPDANAGTALTLTNTAASPVSVFYLKFDMHGVGTPASYAKLGLRAATAPSSNAGGSVTDVPNSSWSESTITWNNAPPPVGTAVATLVPSSRDGTTSGQITSAANADPDRVMSLRVTGLQSATLVARSRETGDPARLIFTIPNPLIGDVNSDGHVDTADLVTLLGTFGQAVVPNTFADLNGDGAINTADLTLMLGSYGS